MDYNSAATDAASELDSAALTSSRNLMAEKAVDTATFQLMASTDFKKPRMARIAKYQELYDGHTTKKLRQLFNIPIPVFPGMIDTLNAQHDTPIQLKFKEGDAADYFKVLKINGAFNMEVMNTNQNSKWDSKLRMVRKHAIMTGRGIVKLTASSDPEYKSELTVVNIKNFHFQPRGGLYLENHLFAGEEDIEKTESELKQGVASGDYDKAQVQLLISRCNDKNYLPDNSQDYGVKLSRFKPLGLNPDNTTYVGEPVYKLAQWILNIKGERYLLVFHPWTKTWLRFQKWKEIDSTGLYPWFTFATHEDDENFLSKSYADDLFPAADGIVAMFNQEMTNREKRNFGARAYDKDMFNNVQKLDESMHRPDALVPADTKGGTRRISEGIYEFKVGELNGTVNLIDWVTGNLGRNTGATDLSQGATQDPNKKASVTFAEQKNVSKRIGWASQPFQDMMASLGKCYIGGLRDHMPSKMAIKLLGENGMDWDEITRLDLNTSKDVDVLIVSSDHQNQESDMKLERRKEALTLIGADPVLAAQFDPKWRAQEVARAVGGYEDAEIASAMDVKTSSDRKSLAKAAEAIQLILQGQEPMMWYAATIPFMQKIVDFAADKRSTLGDKFDKLMQYAMEHESIVADNLERKVAEDARMQQQTQMQAPQLAAPTQQTTPPANPGMSGGMSRAMNIAKAS